jgi:hypothetical protein
MSERHVRLVRLYFEGGFLVTALRAAAGDARMLGVVPAIEWPLSSAIAALIFSLVLVTQYRAPPRDRARALSRYGSWRSTRSRSSPSRGRGSTSSGGPDASGAAPTRWC